MSISNLFGLKKRKKPGRTDSLSGMYSSDEEEQPLPPPPDPTKVSVGTELVKIKLTYYDVYKIISENNRAKHHGLAFAEKVLFESGLPLKKRVTDILSPDFDEELERDFKAVIKLVQKGLKSFIRKYCQKDNRDTRKLVKEGGADANETFLNLEDYEQIWKMEDSQGTYISSQQSGDSTKSWIERRAFKPYSVRRKQFAEFSSAYKRQLTGDLYKQIIQLALNLNVSVNFLLGYFGFRANYLKNKRVAKAFSLLADKKLDKELPLDKALHVKFRYSLSKRDWIDFRLDFKEFLIMPTDDDLRAYMYELLPDDKLKPFHRGWKMDLVDAVQLTLERLPPDVLDKCLEAKGEILKPQISMGFDGCGNHRPGHGCVTYDEHGNYLDSSNIIYCGCCLTKILRDDEEDTPIYTVPTCNSADAERPILIVHGKEKDKELVKEIWDHFESGTKAVNAQAIFVVVHKGQEIAFQPFLHMCQMDGKLTKIIQGRGGGYCLLCSAEKTDMYIRAKVEEGFPMDLGIQELWDWYHALAERNKDGEWFLDTKKLSTQLRIGLTEAPMAEEMECAAYLPPLHAYLRTLAFFIDMIIRLKAEHFTHNETKTEKMNKDIAAAKQMFRDEAKEALKKAYMMPSTKGGTSDDGNAARYVTISFKI